MSSRLVEIFEDKKLVEKIKRRLPYLFQLAELESSRAGKIGMEVGSLREKIMIALLIHKFGVDARLFGQPISIKTITGGGFSGVKLIWTVDAQKAKEFREGYYPRCDILLVQVNWNANGGLYYIPLKVQQSLFDKIGRNRYIKLPKPGTNPRGVEITGDALSSLVNEKETKLAKIRWQQARIDYNPYKRWVEYWEEE